MKIINNKFGFTLAEVLITLVIIGIVASLTIPVQMANTRRTEVETKLEQIYSVLNNALTKAVAEHGPVYTWDETSVDSIDADDEDKFLIFFRKYLEPHLIFAKPPVESTYLEYGYKGTVKSGKTRTFDKNAKNWMATLNNGVILFQMLHGAKYNVSTEDNTPLGYSAVSYVFDINGTKGPNQAGKDIFIYSLFIMAENPVFEMHGLSTYESIPYDKVDTYWKSPKSPSSTDDILKYCGHSTNGWSHCGALIQRNGWKIPKDYPIRI